MCALLSMALNSWGYAVDDIVYSYTTGSGNDTSIGYFVIQNDETKGLTCGVAFCKATGDVVIPGTITTEENKTLTVVQSGPGASTAIANEYGATTYAQSDITSLTFSENLTTVYLVHLTGCKAKTLNFPASLKTFNPNSSSARAYMPNLTKITVASGNTTFKVAQSTEGADMLIKNNTNLEMFAFLNESGEAITEITIPEGVTYADGHVLAGDYSYKKLTTVNLPSTFKSFYITETNHFTAFSNYSYITTYTVANGNPTYCAYDGILYKKPVVEDKEYGDTLCLCPMGKYTSKQEVTIPDGVKAIDRFAFQACKFKTVTIPEGVTDIKNCAFYGCNNLTTVNIPSTTTKIGDGAFANCTKMQAINVADGNTVYASLNGVLYTADYKQLLSCPAAKTGEYSIHEDTEEILANAFQSSKLTGLNLKSAKNLKYIRSEAFYGMASITSLEIPASVQLIQYEAMQNMTSLASLTFEHTDDTSASLVIGDRVIVYTPLTNVVFPSHLTQLGVADGASSNSRTSICGAGTAVSFEEGSRLTTLGRFDSGCNEIDNNHWLTSIDLSNCTKLTSLPTNCFAELTKLEWVKLPSSIKNIPEKAFYKTTSMTSIDFGENSSITKINDNAFQECGIGAIDLPDHVTTVGFEAFRGCANLATVEVPASATSIDAQAFKYCTNLVKFDVDDNNTTYADTDGMLASKDKKTLVIFPPGKASKAGTFISPSFETIGEYACYACTNLEGIVIPKHVTKIGNYAFEFCDNLNSITFLGDVPPTQVEGDVASDNAKSDPNLQDHRFGNADETPAQFLKNHVTINLRKNGNEDLYKATNCYWHDAKDYTYSFSATGAGDGYKTTGNNYDYLASSATAVMVLGSTSTNPTAVVPAKVTNPDNNTSYDVAIVGDYAFEDISDNVNEIVFLGPIELIGANAFNNGHYNNTYKTNPTSPIGKLRGFGPPATAKSVR